MGVMDNDTQNGSENAVTAVPKDNILPPLIWYWCITYTKSIKSRNLAGVNYTGQEVIKSGEDLIVSHWLWNKLHPKCTACTSTYQADSHSREWRSHQISHTVLTLLRKLFSTLAAFTDRERGMRICFSKITRKVRMTVIFSFLCDWNI